jgi:hypothetical protein
MALIRHRMFPNHRQNDRSTPADILIVSWLWLGCGHRGDINYNNGRVVELVRPG